MNRLIDLQTALDLLEKDINENGEPPESDYNIGINHARCVISTIPSAQPEWKHGKWIEKEHDVPLARDDSPSPMDIYDEESHSIKQKWWHCSECGYEADRFTHPSWNFCPNCGARME